MKSSIRAKKVLQKWSVMLILLAVTAVLSAASGPPKASLQQRRHRGARSPGARSPAQHNNAPAQHAGGNTRGRVEQARIIEVLAGKFQQSRPGGNAANRGTTGANTHTKRAPIAPVRMVRTWWRQRQPSPDGAGHGGAGANHNAANAAIMVRPAPMPPIISRRAAKRLSERWRIATVRKDGSVRSVDRTACTSSMEPTAAARLSARTTERASSTQDAMADTCSGPMSIAAVTLLLRTYYHNGVYSTGVYRGYIRRSQLLRLLSGGFLRRWFLRWAYNPWARQLPGCGRWVGRSAVVWLLRWLVQIHIPCMLRRRSG